MDKMFGKSSFLANFICFFVVSLTKVFKFYNTFVRQVNQIA